MILHQSSVKLRADNSALQKPLPPHQLYHCFDRKLQFYCIKGQILFNFIVYIILNGHHLYICKLQMDMREMVESQVRCMLLLDQMACSQSRLYNVPKNMSALYPWPSSTLSEKKHKLRLSKFDRTQHGALSELRSSKV